MYQSHMLEGEGKGCCDYSECIHSTKRRAFGGHYICKFSISQLENRNVEVIECNFCHTKITEDKCMMFKSRYPEYKTKW